MSVRYALLMRRKVKVHW